MTETMSTRPPRTRARLLAVCLAAIVTSVLSSGVPAVAGGQRNQTVSTPAANTPASSFDVTPSGVQSNPPSWGLDRIDQRTRPLDLLYAFPNTAATVRAYILSTGIRRSHVDFGGRVEPGHDVIDPLPADDCHGHGTSVAGVVGGASFGVAKAMRLVPVRVHDCRSDNTANIVAGINWVVANATRPAVVLLPSYSLASMTLDNAVNNLINSGFLVVVPAGDSNANACNYSPGRVSPILTVAASTSADAKASFSNYGSCVDLFAPGASINSLWHTSDTATMVRSGTALAAAHVAGCVAIVLEAHPTWTPAQVHAHIVSTATAGVLTGVPAGTPNRLLYCMV